MKRARKSNRISWAPGVNLCQVNLFLSEDFPSKVGQKSQDHLQAKTSSMLHSSTTEYNDLPPGFECNQFLNQSKDEISCISRIKWKCPPLFVFSYNWHVAAGEESREKEDQKLRELRVLEAVYPRLSAIPPCPSVSLDVEEEDYDDNLTPLIPIIPIEEEESMDIKPELAAAVDTFVTVQSQKLHQYMSTNTTPLGSQCDTSPACAKPFPSISPGLEVDLAAASAVVAAIMKNNEQGSLIDMDLLVRIFNDPLMIEKLINNHRATAATVSASSNTVGISTSGLKPAAPLVPLSTPTLDEPAYGVKPTSTVGLLSAGLKPATPPVALLTTTPEKPTTPSVSLLTPLPEKTATPSVSLLTPLPEKTATPSVSLLTPLPEKTATPLLTRISEKPATPLIPLSRPMPGKPATPSVTLPTPTPDMLRPVNKIVHHISNGVLPTLDTQPPQQDNVLASGAKRAASLASISSNELSTVPLTSAGGNLHPVTNQVSTAATMPYQASTGSPFAVKEAHPVKDANYYKNLIRQHGADKQDTQDSQIGRGDSWSLRHHVQ